MLHMGIRFSVGFSHAGLMLDLMILKVCSNLDHSLRSEALEVFISIC